MRSSEKSLIDRRTLVEPIEELILKERNPEGPSGYTRIKGCYTGAA